MKKKEYNFFKGPGKRSKYPCKMGPPGCKTMGQ